ncbi:MAG: galactose oxidase-like domain-containing protein [Gemmatimonadota bacterium]
MSPMRVTRLHRSARSFAPFAPLVLALTLFACGPDRNSVEPELLGARASGSRVSLSVDGAGSTAGGVVTSDRGGISCTITFSGGVANRSGKCAQDFKTGATVTLTGVPANGGVVSSWVGCNGAAESAQSCSVKLSDAVAVSVRFGPPSSMYTLTIAGGAGGSGKITSSPAGINCTVTSGTAGATGCTTSFATGASVSLSAVSSTGSYLKAWAGAGCDASGTGAGAASGSCVVSMSAVQNVVVSFDRTSPVADAGEWSAPMTWPAIAIHSHLLPDGRVLTWGRSDHVPVLWTPGTNTFASITKPADLFCSGHSFLADGRLLSAGGHSGIDNKGILASTIFDFATNTWVTGPSMQNGRWYPSNTTLATGEVLTLSGGDTAQKTNLIPEVYQPGQPGGSWRVLSTASLYLPYFPMAFVTPTGTVFVAGPSQTTYYLDPTGTGHWSSGPSSLYGNRDYGSALMYEAGKILMVGGGGPTASAEKIDLNPGSALTWSSAGSMAVARRQSNATLLADGKVLVTGGTNAPGFNNPPTVSDVLAAELWDPATGGWKTLARMTHNRLYHSTALLLPDGRVLSAGSGQPSATGLTDDYTAEIFSPPYLFNADGTPATRPTIGGAPTPVTAVTYGQSFDVQTPAPTSVSKVMIISLGSVTHSTNMNQHGMHLTFTVNGTSAITVASPTSAALAPPGHYLLFIIDNRGVPSVARTVRIN